MRVIQTHKHRPLLLLHPISESTQLAACQLPLDLYYITLGGDTLSHQFHKTVDWVCFHPAFELGAGAEYVYHGTVFVSAWSLLVWSMQSYSGFMLIAFYCLGHKYLCPLVVPFGFV